MAKLTKSIEKAAAEFDAFDEHVKSLTTDELSKAPLLETEPQVKLSNREMAKMDGIVLKPDRRINSKENFNEKFRNEYDFKNEMVPFMAENKEIIGETIELWTKPFPGISAEFWKVPVNKKVWGPRYLAEQISSKSYTRLTMEDRVVSSDGMGSYTGQMVATNRIQRLDARPARGSAQVAMASDF